MGCSFSFAQIPFDLGIGALLRPSPSHHGEGRASSGSNQHEHLGIIGPVPVTLAQPVHVFVNAICGSLGKVGKKLIASRVNFILRHARTDLRRCRRNRVVNDRRSIQAKVTTSGCHRIGRGIASVLSSRPDHDAVCRRVGAGERYFLLRRQ